MKNNNNNSFSIKARILIWFQKGVIRTKYDDLVIGGIVLFLFVFFSGYITTFMPLSNSNTNKLALDSQIEFNKIIIPVILGINISIVTIYMSAIRVKLKETEKRRAELIIPRIDLEYLSLIKDALKELPDRLDGISEGIDNIRRILGEKGFKQKLEQDLQEYYNRQKAIISINKGLENEGDINGLNSTIRAVTDFALGNDSSFHSKDTFIKNMYAYITAWLVCSISNNQNMANRNSLPIDSIFYQDPKRKSLYIKAINDFADRLNYEPASNFFKNRESVKITQDYLAELVYLINNKTIEPQQVYVIHGSASDINS